MWGLWAAGALNGVLVGAGIYSAWRTLQWHQRNQDKARFWDNLEQSWQPCVQACLSGKSSPQEVWQQVQAGQELFFVDYLMGRAVRNPEEREGLRPLATPFLPALSARLAERSGDPEQRARAVQTVALLGQQDSLNLLVRSLEDPSPLVTLMALIALSQQRAAAFAVPMLEQLPRLAEWHLGLLSQLLVRLGIEAAPAIRSYLAEATDADTQSVCLSVLARLKDAEAIPLAIRLLSASSDVNVQVASLQVLGQLGNHEHLPLIRECYDSPHFAVRLAVIRALHQQQSEADQSIFQRAVEDHSRWVALQAAQALKATGSQHVLHEMTFMKHPRASLATQVLQHTDNVQELEQAVRQADFQHRVGQLFQKLQSQDTREVQRLITRLFFQPETHPDVRYAMARELARFRNYQFFFQTLSSFILGAQDRRSLIRALHSFANPEAVPALIDYYRNGASWDEKLEIIDALGDIDSMESLAFLSHIYNDLYERRAGVEVPPEAEVLQQRLADALARKLGGGLMDF
ncbi:MAG: HEAT repeat domain-containing protein [Candidatus Sericytochromatia bacterium]